MLKKNTVIIGALLFFVTILTTGSQSGVQYQWKLADSNNGCQVFTSPSPGKEYIAAKAVCVIPAKMEVVGMVIRDIINYPAWMSDCKDTKMLKVVNDQADVFVFWFQQHVPILTDRDMVLKSDVTLNYPKGWCLIKAFSTDDIAYDSKKGYVRMPHFSCEFLLEWVDRENTRVSFTIDPDLGKGVPVGIANSTIKGIPAKSLEKMKLMVKHPKYIESAKTSKYNKMINDAIKAGYPALKGGK
ncbi:MAG TPA: START domain-containing protein [Spirochaetota bacterium]|nr:START domain-containing protein [Spirochaetota bacterium]HPL18724.1 START domain-containing protein [Spirochaetota bacterium]HQJ69486.1 START domain-containing protein [Spirochaetota bacterium]HRS75586.1 START domain-containing protein [Spirochaetota bacterium]HRT75922.1 START domain-containing protein [Spirochaetota bacterium]